MSARLSVNINDETAEALKELTAARGITVTELIRRAVSVYKFVDEETKEKNKVLQLTDGKETTNLMIV